MRRFFCMMLTVLLLVLLAVPAFAEGAAGAAEPFTWGYLGSIAGATAFVLLAVQMLKAPLDMFLHIPTRLLAYLIALITLLLANAFTDGLTVESALLCAVNACVVALSAMGAYEMTFSQSDKEIF